MLTLIGSALPPYRIFPFRMPVSEAEYRVRAYELRANQRLKVRKNYHRGSLPAPGCNEDNWTVCLREEMAEALIHGAWCDLINA